MKSSLTTKTTGIITVVAFVLIYVGTMTLNISVERLENSQLASKQFQLMELLDSVVLDLNRAEGMEHDYVVTGDKACVDSYNAYFKRIEGSLKKLHELRFDNNRYVMLLDELTESVSFRRSCAVEVINQRESSGEQAALQRSHMFDEGRLTKHVEWLAKDVSHTINDELTRRFSQLSKDSITSMAGISTILCAALLFLVIFIIIVNRYVQERNLAESSLREAQQAISEREARMRALVDTAPDGIVTIRPDGLIESANVSFGQMMGSELADIVGQDIKVFIPGFLGDAAVREMIAVRSVGGEFPVEVSISIVNLGAYEVYIGIVRDITERREIEDKVKDFYSMVSHELRTPLASIRTALGIMENNTEETNPAKMAPVVHIAATEADRLMRLINDILDMRKVESGKLDLLMDVLDARTVVTRAIDGVKGLAQEASLTVESRVDPQLELYCDEDRTLQVLTNFLANAIKFSPTGGTIFVECKAVGSHCRFSVTDHGPGVPKAQVHKLFGRFEQLRSADGKQRPGSGLGLAIAKAIVEQHGGQIGVELPEEGGSTFWFSLPLALDDDEQIEKEAQAVSAVHSAAAQASTGPSKVALNIGSNTHAAAPAVKGKKGKKSKR